MKVLRFLVLRFGTDAAFGPLTTSALSVLVTHQGVFQSLLLSAFAAFLMVDSTEFSFCFSNLFQELILDRI